MKRYVVGFLFVEMSSVLLLRKRPGPYYVSNRWNGVGGKIEPGESPYGAMVREAREEAGINLPEGMRWQKFHYERHDNIHGSGQGQSELHFYCANLALMDVRPSVNPPLTDEPVETFRISMHYGGVIYDQKPLVRSLLVPNLKYLVPMAYHWLKHPNERYLEG